MVCIWETGVFGLTWILAFAAMTPRNTAGIASPKKQSVPSGMRFPLRCGGSCGG
jgi:hypothetical protein